MVVRSFLFWLALTLLMAGPAVAREAEPTFNLQPRWEAGQVSRYQLWSKEIRHTTMEMGGRSREASITMVATGEMTWRVNEVNADGAATATMTLDWMRVKMSGPRGKSQTYDSRKGGKGPMQEVVEAMTGVDLTVRISADGGIDRVSGTGGIRQALDHPELAPEKGTYRQWADELAAIPQAPAKASVGESWSTAFRWPHRLGSITPHMRYKLTGVERIAGLRVANVAAEGEVGLKVDRDRLPDQGPSINIQLIDGSRRAQIMFGLTRHEVVGRNSTTRLRYDMTMSMGQRTLRQKIEQRMQSQVLRIEEED